MTDRVDELFAHYAEATDRVAKHGWESLSNEDFEVLAAVSLSMYQAAVCELDRREARKYWDPNFEHDPVRLDQQEVH